MQHSQRSQSEERIPGDDKGRIPGIEKKIKICAWRVGLNALERYVKDHKAMINY